MRYVPHMPYSDEELLAEIRAVATAVGDETAPTLKQFREHGSMAATTVTRRFGSWQAAVEKAGFEPHSPTESVSQEALREELHRLADAVGEIPTGEQMRTDGEYSVSAYQTHFGSWTDALEDAFNDPTAVRATHTTAELLAELRRLADEDGPPRYREMDADGAYAARTYVNRFGSWNAALKAADLTPTEQKSIPDAALLADLQRLHAELGHRPTPDDVRDHGDHGVATYQRRFGSWSAAVTAAFEDAGASTEPSNT